jgi:hypothetical protein
MDFPGSDPFAIAGNHGEDAGCEGIRGARSPSNQAANPMGAASRRTKRLQRRSFRRRDGPIYPAPVARRLISSRMPPIREKIADSRKRSMEEIASNRRRIPATPRLERDMQTHPLQRAKLSSIQAPGHGRRGAFQILSIAL